MKFNNILVEEANEIAIVTINRPKKLNALNKETILELSNAFKALEENSIVKVIILTGSGDKSFVAGADISEFAHFSVENGGKLARKGQEMLFDLIEKAFKSTSNAFPQSSKKCFPKPQQIVSKSS